MSDWGDEETTAVETGRSFGGKNTNSDDKSDDGWAPSGYNNDNGSNDGDGGDRFGNGSGRGRGGGRGGRGGRGGGRGGGGSYNDENGDGGFPRRGGGGKFNRDNGEENDGSNQDFMKKDEFLQIPHFIPQDYEKETVTKFIKDLPKLRKVANLVEMHCIDSYIKKACNNFFDGALNKDYQSSNAESQKNKSKFFEKSTKSVKPISSLNEEQQQRANILAEQREDFMHNLIFAGREKETELSPTRRAQVREEELKKNESFWRKKFEKQPELREMLEKHYEQREKVTREGFGSLLSELQSDRYEITVSDLEQADRRQLGLLRPDDGQYRLKQTLSNNDKRQSCMTLRSSSRKIEEVNNKPESQSSVRRATQRSDQLDKSFNNITQYRPRRLQNLSEQFMCLRLPYETTALQPFCTTSKPPDSMLMQRHLGKASANYSEDHIFPRYFRDMSSVTLQFSEENSPTRDEPRDFHTEALFSTSASIPPMHTLLENSSAKQQDLYSTISRDISNSGDLPHVHQTNFGQESIGAESTPVESRRLSAFYETIDNLQHSPISHRVIPEQNASSTSRREDIRRLTAIVEQRETLAIERRTEYEVIAENNELLVRQDSNAFAVTVRQDNEIDTADPSANQQPAIIENGEITSPEVAQRIRIPRLQNVPISYANADQCRRRRRRRRRRPQPQNNAELPIMPVDNLAILPPPPIRYNEEVEMNIEGPLPPILEQSVEREILERAQERHEQFLFDNIETLSKIMDSPINLSDMMQEYIEVCKKEDPIRFYKSGPLISGFSYDHNIILERTPRELEIKLHLIEELVKNSSINLYRMRDIKTKEEAITALSFLTELKGDNLVEIRNNAEKVFLK